MVRTRGGARHDYRVLRVGEDTFADPRDGTEHSRVVIEAHDWCNVVPLTGDGHAVLVRQFRFGTGEISLEIPGGVVDEGEEPAAAALRELEEETGYRAGVLLPLGTYSPNPAHFTNRVHAFVALDCAPLHDGRPEAGEDLGVEIVPRAALADLVREGRITHSLMISSLYLAHLRGHI